MDVKIPFDTNWKHVAISLSGGADSALLAYLICDWAKRNRVEPLTLHCISHTRMWKTRPWQQWDSLRVFNWLQEEFSHIKFVRHTNFIAPELEWGDKGPTLTDEYGKTVSGDNIQQRAFAEHICHYNNVDVYFNAVTRNPRGVEFTGLFTRDVEPTEDNKHLEVMTHMGRLVCHPFRFVEKSWVVKKYIELGIMDLFYRTRSCEGEFDNITYETYTPNQFVPQCMECFLCKERVWALKVNGPIPETL
jgi:hypothetical protein